MKILQNLKNAVKQALNMPVVSVSVASYDVGKCTKCKFNINDRCTVGTYYAEQGKNRFCIEGESWEATERQLLDNHKFACDIGVVSKIKKIINKI